MILNKGCRFTRYHRISKNIEFDIIFKKGKKVRNDKISIFLTNNNCKFSRLGIAISKHVKKAVARNYLKRIAREVFRKNKHLLVDGSDIIILFKAVIKYKELEDFFVKIFPNAK